MLVTRPLRRAFFALVLIGLAQAADAHAILMDGYPMPNSTMLVTRPLRRAFFALVLIGLAQAADAHAILMDGYPMPNSTMPAGTAAIRLRFNSRIDIARSRLTLITPDGAEHRLQARPGPTPDIMEADTQIAAGVGQLHWQVLAIDGHITRGVIPFTAMAR